MTKKKRPRLILFLCYLCYHCSYLGRKGVNQDEKAVNGKYASKRGGLLECHEKTGETESWHGMPQMKRLKELSCWSATKHGRQGRQR